MNGKITNHLDFFISLSFQRKSAISFWLSTILSFGIMGNMLLMNNNTQIVVSRAAMTEFRERLEPLGSRTRDKKKIRDEDE